MSKVCERVGRIPVRSQKRFCGGGGGTATGDQLTSSIDRRFVLPYAVNVAVVTALVAICATFPLK